MERILPFLDHPEIGNEPKSTLMQTMCAPTSPEGLRRETGWVYSQGAPSVFRGDLLYYFIEHDLSDTAHLIDTSKIGVWILSGEYDWTAPPAVGQRLAAEIEGAHFVLMRGMGHFPMSEAPERFKEIIMPILREAAAFERSPLASV
jgi:pimeloyl-ACP methyl ester carboxylesterase